MDRVDRVVCRVEAAQVWQAEWARQAGEREVIRQALQDAASAPEDVCLEIELCRVAGAFNSALTAP